METKLKCQEANKYFKISEEVLKLKPKIIQNRREFHQIPETAYEEFKTSEKILEKVKEIDVENCLEIKSKLAGGTGIVVILKGNQSNPCIMLRSDIDALPIKENTGLSFSSKNEGKQHACGHDGHMAMLLGALEIIYQKKSQLKGTIKFVFQPAEEGGAGALKLIEDPIYPLFENPTVDQIFGQHLFSNIEFGKVVIQERPVSCNSDQFRIQILTKGGHCSQPFKTNDANQVCANLIVQLYQIIGNQIDPNHQAALVVGKIDGGQAPNVISSETKICGSMRTLYQEDKDKIIAAMQNICKGMELLYNAKINLEIVQGYPSLKNTKKEVELFQNSASKIILNPQQSIITDYCTLIGEDFAYYSQKKPGCFIFVGSSIDEMSIQHHTPTFTINENALEVGTQLWVQLVYDLLL